MHRTLGPATIAARRERAHLIARTRATAERWHRVLEVCASGSLLSLGVAVLTIGLGWTLWLGIGLVVPWIVAIGVGLTAEQSVRHRLDALEAEESAAGRRVGDR